jgi:hypothetical protein
MFPKCCIPAIGMIATVATPKLPKSPAILNPQFNGTPEKIK